MTDYLRGAKERREAILNDTPDTKFSFKSQRFEDIPRQERPSVNNLTQMHSSGAKEVADYDSLIEDAARRNAIDPDIVRAIIHTEVSRGAAYGRLSELVHAADTLYPGTRACMTWPQIQFRK